MTFERDDSKPPNTDNVVLFGDAGETSVPSDMPLTIGNVSRLLGVSRLRLLSYEVRGLIKRRRYPGQGLVYRWEDCARVVLIVKAGKAGLSVRQLAPLIRATRSGASLEAITLARWNCLALLDQLDRRRQALRHALAEVKFLYDQLSEKLPVTDTADTAARYDGSESD
jgi:DNA-binding transcriptional MerR regulator